MIFITLVRFRKKATKAVVAEMSRLLEQGIKEGGKMLGQYLTLGRYDMIVISEAKDEATYMKWMIRAGDLLSTETLVAVPREEALKLIE
jgi:uncharacterized protein with GYD domain